MISESDYVDLAVRLVHQTVDSGRPHITAAALGDTLRRSVSDRSWKDFGYKSLSELLRSDNASARLELINTSKNALAVRPRPGAPAQEPSPKKEYNPLHKAVWGAFVFPTPTGLRFLNRKTGAVRSALIEPPSPLDEWVEIPSISVSEQKAWANEFLDAADFPVTQKMKSALDEASWNHAFSTALAPHGGAWNKFRSAKVASRVDEWAASSGVSHDLVFQSQAVLLGQPESKRAALEEQDRERAAILAAIATLPTERLRQIELPAGVILEALRSL